MPVRRDGEKEWHLHVAGLMQRFQGAAVGVELIRIDAALLAGGEGGDEDERLGRACGAGEESEQNKGEEGAHGDWHCTQSGAAMSTALTFVSLEDAARVGWA